MTKQLAVASFSSSGPTPISLGMKPDVAAPGVTSPRRFHPRTEPGRPSAGRAWRRRTSPGRLPSCSSAIRTGRLRRSSRRSSSRASRCPRPRASCRHAGGRRPGSRPRRERPADLRGSRRRLVRARPHRLTGRSLGRTLTDAGGGGGPGRRRWPCRAASAANRHRPPTVTVPGRLDLSRSVGVGAGGRRHGLRRPQFRRDDAEDPVLVPRGDPKSGSEPTTAADGDRHLQGPDAGSGRSSPPTDTRTDPRSAPAAAGPSRSFGCGRPPGGELRRHRPLGRPRLHRLPGSSSPATKTA